MTKSDLDSAIEIAQAADKILREEFDRPPSISYKVEPTLSPRPTNAPNALTSSRLVRKTQQRRTTFS
jgi:hypothetical protein